MMSKVKGNGVVAASAENAAQSQIQGDGGRGMVRHSLTRIAWETKGIR